MRIRSVWGAAVVGAAVAFGGCGDDSTSPPPTTDLEAVAGLYDPVEITFDPQGSPPPANVLKVISEVEPRLNVDLVGSFQVPHRDPETGRFHTIEGTTQPTAEGIRLVFATQADADLLLFPRTLDLTFDEDAGTLTFDGNVSVPRNRLLALFPEEYADEAFQNPTPGTLTVRFER